MKIIIITVLTAVLAPWSLACAGYAQKWEVISKDEISMKLESVNNCFIHMHNYSVNVTDESFASYTASVYHERYTGYYKRGTGVFHSCLGSLQTIQNKEFRIAVDSVRRTVMIADPSDYFDKEISGKDYSALLKVCNKTMVSRSGNVSVYRLEFDKGYPLTAYELTLKDSLPQKIVMYYSKTVKGANENNLDKPRMEIYFDNWVLNTASNKEEFNADRYVYKQGDKYFLKPPYSSRYKLLDERVLTRKDTK